MKIISLKNGLVCLFLVFIVWISALFSHNIVLMNVRPLVSKTHGDMYAIAKVLESYRVETGTYTPAFPIMGTLPKSHHTYCAAISEQLLDARREKAKRPFIFWNKRYWGPLDLRD